MVAGGFSCQTECKFPAVDRWQPFTPSAAGQCLSSTQRAATVAVVRRRGKYMLAYTLGSRAVVCDEEWL